MDQDKKRMRLLILGLCILVFVICFVFFFIYSYKRADKGRDKVTPDPVEEKVTSQNKDNTQKEAHVANVNNPEENIELQAVSGNEDKVGISTKYTFITVYEESGYEDLDDTNAYYADYNCTMEELAKRYEGWTITEFSKEKVVFKRVMSGGQNDEQLYFIIYKDGHLLVYKKNPNGKDVLEDDIEIYHISDEDKEKYEKGITVYEHEVIRILESFTS